MSIQELIKQKKSRYKYFTQQESLEAVKQNRYALQFVHEQTEAICLEAVKQNGYALQFVHEQTEAICLEAVKQDGDALQFVHEYKFKVEAKELTLNEISKLLGFDVKIIK